MSLTASASADRSVTRVRHEVRLRLVEVVAKELVTPRLVRIKVAGDQLRGFASPGFDDHVKVFIPADGNRFLNVPVLGRDGPILEAGARRPVMRDYTPHDFDPVASTLQLDFVLHDAGPATAWARRVDPGDRIIIGGPRGSSIIGAGFDLHLLIGDETAMPAIRRRLSELPAGLRVLVIAEVDGPEDEGPLESRAELEVRWCHRTHRSGEVPFSLSEALTGVHLHEVDYYAWIACESADAKALRAALLARGVHRSALKASGYWRRGAQATHDVHE